MRAFILHPYILLIIAPFIWSTNTIIGRLATDTIQPYTLTAFRWMITLVIILPFAYRSLMRDAPLIKKHWLLLIAYGLIGFGGFNLLLYSSLHYTTAINATLIQAATPMIILCMSMFIFSEHLHRLQITGIIMTMAGVALIVTKGHLSHLLSLAFNKGDIMLVTASLLYAAYSIALRYKPPIGWISFLTIGTVGALSISIPFALYEAVTVTTPIIWSWNTAGIVVYTALFSSIIAQISYAQGVSIIGASRAGAAINLIPVFGSIMAIFFLNESFHWYHSIALLCVFIGIGLSEYIGKKSHS